MDADRPYLSGRRDARDLKEAMTTSFDGLKVIVAEGECQLERQRRLKPLRAQRRCIRRTRVVRMRYGVDDETCTGDHSCIRLSGCPTLTVKTSGDPLKSDPVAHVTNGCVGCGLCGEAAHAATLCPVLLSRRDRLQSERPRQIHRAAPHLHAGGLT